MKSGRTPQSPARLSGAAAAESPKTDGSWRWNPARMLLATMAIFIISQFGVAAVLIIVGALIGTLAGQGSPAPDTLLGGSTVTQFVTILIIEVLVISGVYWMVRRQGLRLHDIGLTRPKWLDMLYALVALGVYFTSFLLIVAAVQQLIPGLDTEQRQDIGFSDATDPLRLALVFVALVVLAPLAEEILFRGFLYTGLRQRMRFVWAALLTSLLFGSPHLLGGEQGASLLWIAGLDTLILSFVLCYIRERTGRLWAPILLHAMKNAIAFSLLFVFNVA